MSVQKKSLINNRAAAKKAMIASQPTEGTESGKLKASTVKAQTLKASPGMKQHSLKANPRMTHSMKAKPGLFVPR